MAAPKADSAAEVAEALFTLANHAMRDAARLTVIASNVARGKLPYAHFAMANYIARRDGSAYAMEDIKKLIEALRAVDPDVAGTAKRYARSKELAAERGKGAEAERGRFRAMVERGVDPRAAVAAVYSKRKGNVVAVNFGQRPGHGAA